MKKTVVISTLFVGMCLIIFIYLRYGNLIFAGHRIQTIRKGIEAETGANQEPDCWAGSYYMGDGLGSDAYLDIALKSGFAFEEHGCLGLYDRNYGKVKFENDGRLKLIFALPNENVMISNELIIVKWGKRTYLIPPDRIPKFCEAIKNKMEPRYGMRGLFFLREGDNGIEVDGRPDLPIEYLDLLVEEK
ncbi:hypothetical protein JW824_13470 [bacterium]|nr:hypothetical protein [bacterium]